MGWAVFQRVKRARFQRMGVGGSRGWGAQFPTVRDNCFYLRRGLLFSWEMSAVVWCYILAPGSQHPFPHSRPVPEAYHSGLSSCNCRPRCTPIARAPVSDCKHEPVCWPLRIKENGGGGGIKKVALPPADAISQRSKYLWPFTPRCCLGAWSQHEHPLLGSPVGRPASLLSLAASAAPWQPQPESSVGPFRIPVLSTCLEVISAHPWLSISSSASLQLFISGECYPLYFYFQLGSGRRC